MRAVLLAGIAFAALAHAAELPWIENDYARALETAKQANKPLFVEMWAPW